VDLVMASSFIHPSILKGILKFVNICCEESSERREENKQGACEK
jgi:hypothetical protein